MKKIAFSLSLICSLQNIFGQGNAAPAPAAPMRPPNVYNNPPDVPEPADEQNADINACDLMKAGPTGPLPQTAAPPATGATAAPAAPAPAPAPAPAAPTPAPAAPAPAPAAPAPAAPAPPPAAPAATAAIPAPAAQDQSAAAQPILWSTGPLIAPPGDLADLGGVVWELYEYAIENYGFYSNSWKGLSTPLFTNLSSQALIRVGVFPVGELDLTPILNFNHVHGASQWLWGDMPISLNILFLEDDTWYHPNFKVSLLTNLPTGAYQRLSAKKQGTDIGGSGCWYPGAGLIYYHVANIYGPHFLTSTGYVAYMYGTSAHVKGVNAYGGDATTNGTVYPGSKWQGIVSFEYSLDQNWVLALDMVYYHTDKTKFTGKTHLPVGGPSSDAFSLAPAIEYNLSDNLGIIAGSWFTVAGRNTDQFASAVIEFYFVK